MGSIKKAPKIKLKDLNKIDWNSPKLKAEEEEIKKSNKKLLEATKPDWTKMNQTFDF